MTSFFMAWQMFLWIPCPKAVWDENKKVDMLMCLPAIGIIIGALWYCIFVMITLFAPTFPKVLCALFAFFPWLLTGFMHLDGYMDCADAALYFGNHDKKLQILKDSHVGSFAVISMALIAVFQYSACSQMATNMPTLKEALCFVLIPVISRSKSVADVLKHPALPTSSYASITDSITDKRITIVPWISILVCMIISFVFAGWRYSCALVIGLLVQSLSMHYLRKNLGGMSGDVSGSGITVGELACLIAVAFI